jgi:ABC-type Mn2+/Zn2+ transport system permease subunit
MESNLLFQVAVGAFVGAAAGYLGSFMVLKRMSLVGDAMSHVALPGMAIAIALNFSPIIGAVIALTFAVIGIWYFSETSSIYPEALVGVFFTASLAIGILITPEPDLLEALFGNIEKITFIEGLIAIGLTLLIILMTRSIAKSLILGVGI